MLAAASLDRMDGWMLHTLRQYTWRGRKRPGCEARRPPPSKLWRPGRQEAGTLQWPHRHSGSRQQTNHSHSELVRAAETEIREKGAAAAARLRGAGVASQPQRQARLLEKSPVGRPASREEAARVRESAR